jgi:hypothetical protein
MNEPTSPIATEVRKKIRMTNTITFASGRDEKTRPSHVEFGYSKGNVRLRACYRRRYPLGMKPKSMACKKCKKRKDFNKKFFPLAAGNKHGLGFKCRDCVNKKRRAK